MYLQLAADLLEIAERLLLDGGQSAGDVALGRLRFGEVVGLVRLDDVVLVGLPDLASTSRRSLGDRARALARCSPPVISEVSPNTP